MIVECPGCHLRYDMTGRPPGTKVRCRCGREYVLPSPSTSAEALACPQCGAPAHSSETLCRYCGSALATARCPRCFGLLFQGAQHCSHCGAAVDVPARAATDEGHTQRQCPRCAHERQADLVAHLVSETLLDQCPECGGVWVDQTAFERLAEQAEKEPSVLQAMGTLPKPRGTVTAEARKVMYLKCPDCGGLMNRKNFAHRSGIILDVCAAHGIWFDRGELPGVVQFIWDGGLEESKRRDLEELRQEEQQLRYGPHVNAGSGWSRTGTAFGDDGLFERRGSPLLGVIRTLSHILK